MQNFEVVNSVILIVKTFLLFVTAKIWPSGAEVIFLPKKFIFEIFSKTNVVSITFRLRYIHGQSLKEIDFLTRSAVDRF